MPLRIAKDETPTRPHVDAEDGLVRGDYAILKLALERAEAECARLRGLIAALPCRFAERYGDDISCAEVNKMHPTQFGADSDCAVCKAKEAARG